MPLTKKAMRLYQRARREAKKTSTVGVELTAKQRKWFERAKDHSKDATHQFARNALLVGAVFRANAGQANGKKIKLPEGLI